MFDLKITEFYSWKEPVQHPKSLSKETDMASLSDLSKAI